MQLRRGVLLCALVMGLATSCTAAPEGDLEHRWLFVMRNLASEENVEETLALLPRAEAAGYTAIVLSDGNLNAVSEAGPSYAQNVRRVQAEARARGLELIPCVMPIGYSGGILDYNPHLAEGLPVRDASFVVQGDRAFFSPALGEGLPGGDFEEAEGDRFAGWDWQDDAGERIHADREVVHGGRTSVRMERIGEFSPEHGHCRFMRTIEVEPYRQYRVSLWIKTEAFERPGAAKATILAPTEQERAISFAYFDVKSTQDWRQYQFIFNSLNWEKVRFYMGTWGGKGGLIWWDDVTLEEVGLLNVLHRGGCPVTVRGQHGTVYEEGLDYEPIRDPDFSLYDVNHEGPTIRLTDNTRIGDGERLLVSYYHPIKIGRWQVTCCLSAPEVYEIMRRHVAEVEDLLHPPAFFMQHDEIRVANWDQSCQSRGMTPGELLADNARRCVEIIREIRPDAEIWVWSDMFDPNHNAVDDYYLVNGTWRGSWEGLPPEVGIANWAGHLKGRNLRWFADRGHEQVLAGYYDHDEDGSAIEEWLQAGEGLPGIVGAMYTTWRDDYSDMETWAETAWGER